MTTLRTRALALAAGAAMISLAIGAVTAGAQSSGCSSGGGGGSSPCVMLIQVDGLEATDVTPEKTPFLWGLANPGEGPASGLTTALGQRNGWTWQAPRAAMTTGLAANTTSLLTGGYPEQTGVIGDEMYKVPKVDGKDGALPTFNLLNPEEYRLESDPDDLNSRYGPRESLSSASMADGVQNILELNEENGGKTSAIVGDPDLAPIANMNPNAPDLIEANDWTPTIRDQDNQGNNDPGGNAAFCDVPRVADPQAPPGGDTQTESGGAAMRACAAKDEVTLNKAFDAMKADDAVNLSYIELAELGHVKRSATEEDSVEAALAELDSNVGAFLNRVATDTTLVQKWQNMIVFVVGSGGYEETPPAQRVPSLENGELAGAGGEDLEDWVEDQGNEQFDFMPQGSVATVYYRKHVAGEKAENPTDEHRARIQTLKRAIEQGAESACSNVALLPETDVTAGSDCISDVLYMRPQLAKEGELDDVVENRYPSWHLDHTFFDINRETFEETNMRTGSSGDLLLVANEGWAFGKAVPTQEELLEVVGTEASDAVTNPYPASNGGPRNRSMAAIVNGPACNGDKCVFNLKATDRRSAGQQVWRYPVASQPEGAADNPSCSGQVPPADLTLEAANANPIDDANAAGHECQAEIVDFGPTIASVLSLSVPFQQIGGRLLHEAIRGLPEISERPEMQPPEAILTAGPLTPAEGQQYPADYEGTPTFGFVGVPDKPQAPSFECQLVSGELTAETMPADGWFSCGDSPDVRPSLCQSTVDNDNDGEPDLAGDGTQVLAPFPCSSYAVTTPLTPGRYTFSVRASNDAGMLPPTSKSTAVFDVITFTPGYDCPKVICDPARAFVSDEKGKTVQTAKKGALLDHVTFEAGFGERFTAVDLTFYEIDKQARKGKGKKGKRVNAKDLTALANFEPFVLDLKKGDAIAKLTFQVPPRYNPTHLGVDLQKLEKKSLTAKKRKQCETSKNSLCSFRSVAKCKKQNTETCFAKLYKIEDAGSLHDTVTGNKKRGGGGKKRAKRASGSSTVTRSIVLSPQG